MKLLLIDDDDVDRMVSIRALDRSGYSLDVTEASTAEEAIKLYQNEKFDIVLLDYQLPTMNGLELIEQLNKSNKGSLAIVMLSNMEDEKLAIKCVEAGAQDFIIKGEMTTSRLIRSILHARERYKIEQQLRHLAEKDSLTGLANRHVFEVELNSSIHRAKRLDKGLALLMLDLDNFKKVNDTHGHAVGDHLLIEVAKRLRVAMRDDDLLCRLGGDEFAILVHDLEEATFTNHLIQRILSSICKPFIVDGVELIVSTSIGIANYPDSAIDAAQLFKCADIAMYRSKEEGRNQAHFYSKVIHDAVQRRIELERDLRGAVERNEFVVYYQPQIDCSSGKVTGAEALVRWQHPIKGLVGPNEFIPIAEDVGLISRIGEWVLDTACAQFSRWQQQHEMPDISLSVAVNLSALQLSLHDFVPMVERILAKHKIDPQKLEFEITESELVKNTDVNARVLKDLSRLGATLVLDDFGTGHSSLVHLQKHPFQVLKVNQSFVQHISNDNDHVVFLKAINAFAKTLGILTIVEGVETKIQKDWCHKLNFDRIQGYYFAKPMPAHEFEAQALKSSFPMAQTVVEEIKETEPHRAASG